MPREDRVHDLRHHRVVVPHDARKYRLSRTQPRHQVVAQLIFDPPRTETLCGKGTSAQLAQSPGNTHGGTPHRKKPWVDYTAGKQLSALSSQLSVKSGSRLSLKSLRSS